MMLGDKVKIIIISITTAVFFTGCQVAFSSDIKGQDGSLLPEVLENFSQTNPMKGFFVHKTKTALPYLMPKEKEANQPDPTPTPIPASPPDNQELYQQYANEITEYMNLAYYDPGKQDQYIKYKIFKPDYNWKTVITFVETYLDKPFYTDIQRAENQNSFSVMVNKYYQLSSSFVPALETVPSEYATKDNKQGHPEAVAALIEMSDALEQAGYMRLLVSSGYRSFAIQQQTYNYWKGIDGQVKADSYSARPGHSEHQTGLALDVATAKTKYTSMGGTSEYQWIKNNAHLYGFIVRYPEGKDHITGYKYEPWHLRYLGPELAAAVYNSGLTFDEYLARGKHYEKKI